MRTSEPDRRDGTVRTSERTGADDDEFDVSFIIPIRPVLAAIATKYGFLIFLSMEFLVGVRV